MNTSFLTRESFGRLPDGGEAEAITLRNAAGMSARVITFGAAIQSVIVPDRKGRMADVALGFATLNEYLADTAYFGATVGRVANRIAGGRFELDGRSYQVPVNNGPNALHGGTRGFDKVDWAVVGTAETPVPSVTLRHISPDGDQGFPGRLEAVATYSLDGKGRLTIDYRATADRPTLVNLTNHAYWNLAGEGAPEGAMDHLLTIPADHFLPTDATAIPSGEFRPVAGTPFDFRQPIAVGARVREGGDEQIGFGRGYDHHWAVSRDRADAPRLLARVEEPRSGRVLEVHSDQPGLQFYSGNFLDGTVRGKSGRLYRQGDCIVLEPQMPPNTPNQPDFGSITLGPDDSYRNTIIFAFSIAR